MHKLETAVAPIITPAIRLESVPYTLNQDAQRIAAFWVVKTALMLALAAPPVYVPPEHYRWLYEHWETREPPDGCTIWLAAYDADKRSVTLASTQLVVHDRRHARYGYLLTVTIGHLAMQVAYFGGGNDTETLDPPFLGRIWPISGAQDWPPGGVACSQPLLARLSKRFTG